MRWAGSSETVEADLLYAISNIIVNPFLERSGLVSGFWTWPAFAGEIFLYCLEGCDPITANFLSPKFALSDQECKMTLG